MLCKFRAAVRIWSVVFPLAAPCAALAQGTSSPPPAANSAADNDQIQEITVTAQRRETSLQDTPIAVTAVTSATISEKGLLDIRDVEKLTPGLAIEIAVTAQRRETSLQDTPIAVTAVTSATISEKGLLDIRDVEKLTPGLAI